MSRRSASAGSTPAGLPEDIKKKLEAACITAKESEPFQRIVKSTLQPSDYFADAAGFAKNLKQGRGRQAAAAHRARHGEELRHSALLSSLTLLRIMSM